MVNLFASIDPSGFHDGAVFGEVVREILAMLAASTLLLRGGK